MPVVCQKYLQTDFKIDKKQITDFLGFRRWSCFVLNTCRTKPVLRLHSFIVGRCFRMRIILCLVRVFIRECIMLPTRRNKKKHELVNMCQSQSRDKNWVTNFPNFQVHVSTTIVQMCVVFFSFFRATVRS